MDGQFLPASQVQPYPDLDPFGAGLMEEFAEDFEDDLTEPEDEEYFDYSQRGASAFRPRYARSSLALNGPLISGAGVGQAFGWALLVTEVRFDDGEHEIWQQGFEFHNRYPSFAGYFNEIRSSIVDSVGYL